MCKWIKVARSSLPEEGRLVIIYDGCCVMFGHYAGLDGRGRYRFLMDSSKGICTAITHWQELPKPPSAYTVNGNMFSYHGVPMSPEQVLALLNIMEDTERNNVR